MLNGLWSEIRYRVRALTRRADLEAELDAELRFHLEREAEKYERLGVPHDDALRRARIAFGGVDRAKEATRDARGVVFLETVWQDLRYTARTLRRRPAFTAGVVLTLGLGIGANAAMFGIVDRLLVRPPAYLRDADRIQRIYLSETRDGDADISRDISFQRYLDLKRESHDFTAFAVYATWTTGVGDGESLRERHVTAATGSYFDFFDARPALGRFFTEQDDATPQGAPVVVLGYGFWMTAFGGRTDVLGQQLRVGHTMCTIIGVAPAAFVGLEEEYDPALYVPVTTFAFDQRGPAYLDTYDYYWLQGIAERKRGIPAAAAEADLTNALRISWRAQRAADAGTPPLDVARPRAMLASTRLARGPMAGPEAKVAAWVSGVALIALLIACANVANLLLARAVTRRREIAMRRALGVSRSRLARQLLTESCTLAALGGVLGVVLAHAAGVVFAALFLPPELGSTTLVDGRTLAFALAATLAAALLTGLVPALQALGGELSQALRDGGRDTGSRAVRGRSALLLVQATMTVVLLVGAGLFVRSLQHVTAVRLGYDVDPVIVVTDYMRGVKLTQSERRMLETRLVDAAKMIPGVVSATPIASIPFWSFTGRRLYVAGVDSTAMLGDFLMQSGNADLFRTLGTRVVRGRAFDEHDGSTAPLVIVVPDAMARLFWPGRDALGQCVRIGADTAPCRTVIGIAEDLHLRSLASRREYTYYVPMAQFDSYTSMQFVRVAGSAEQYQELVRRGLQRVMPGAAYITTQPLRNMVDPKFRSWRIGATMFLAFGALALTLAGVGLYSAIAYGVAQRRHEIGVRVALGAPRAAVLQLVVGDGLRVVAVGIVLGALFAAWASRWLAGLLFEESPRDPVVYLFVASTLALVALIAAAVPARAALRVDPNAAMRGDD